MNEAVDQSDFTESQYRELLEMAKRNYRFVGYADIPWGTRFVLWRHDLDYSLNRALALAEIEAEMGVLTTYFVNPHSEFYNPFEPSQSAILSKILGLGHRLGLHFDASFHSVASSFDLDRHVVREASWLESAFGVGPDAFSFHNPDTDHLSFDAASYGGLPNCYATRFRTEVGYCSDSNGHWRTRRLRDVLAQATEKCLHVLTHPGWWQVKPMAPRSRLLRCAFGRAAAIMRAYDDTMRLCGRSNLRGPSEAMVFLREIDPEAYERVGTLWGLGRLEDALFALRRLLGRWTSRHSSQVADPEMATIDSLCSGLLDGSANPSLEELEHACGVICGRLKTCLQRHGIDEG